MLLSLSDILVLFEKLHIDIGHQCVRCYLRIFLIGVRYENTRENKAWVFPEPNKTQFPHTTFYIYIFNAPHYVHDQSHRNSGVNSQRESSVTAQYMCASC